MTETGAWVLVEFGVVSLAVFRIWVLFASDTILQPVRARLGDRVLSWVTCPWCAGFWLSLIGYLVWRFWGDVEWVQAAAVILAISAVVGILSNLLSEDDG